MAAVLERLRVALAPDYELERELGGGGMGVVFLARDPALDRRVAIKVIRPELATARATERFLREAKLLAQLKHPNIMPVHRAGEAGGFAYYVMDYCEGETLEDRFARGPLSRGEAVRIGRDLLDGLDAVHRAGLIHRDVKPSNVFLVDRRAVLGDFGPAIRRRSRVWAGR
jgi:serine/threonine-protein kinase